MTDERKRELGCKLVELIEEMKRITLETKIGISLMTVHSIGDDGPYVHTCNFLHYGDGRLVNLEDDELKDAFFIERDDSIREEEKNEENTKE